MKFRLELFSESHEVEIKYLENNKNFLVSIDGQWFDSKELSEINNINIVKNVDKYSIERNNETIQVIFKELVNNFSNESQNNDIDNISRDYFVENRVLAPIPGKIVDIRVKEGEMVQEGQILLVLEAMKMENEIASPTKGKLKIVPIILGESVTEKQVLIEFE